MLLRTILEHGAFADSFIRHGRTALPLTALSNTPGPAASPLAAEARASHHLISKDQCHMY